ncbi:MAG: prolyl oligopeptidase family serine peptidase [Isosphaeraceae bacterium]
MAASLRNGWSSALVVFALGVVVSAAHADGPADNLPDQVRRIPKLGIEVSPQVRAELESRLTELQEAINRLPGTDPSVNRYRPDIAILHRAVRDALKYQEFFVERDIQAARDLLTLGFERVRALTAGDSSWARKPSLVVRGYVSRIDGSVQPYGVVLPPNYNGQVPGKFRLDVWFHGRGETLSEVQFLDQRRRVAGEFTPPDTIVLHPYGRYCNANKFAGEVDVLEAIEAVKREYRIDPDRIAVRGFSMGGAACWQFAVHYADQWFAANPGAGFSETPRFLKVFQRESLAPTWYEQKLWRWYDCDLVAVNLSQCPTVAYSGELDNQKQAADVMAEALDKVGIDLVHVIGPQTKHAYHPKAKVEVDRRLASLAVGGRQRVPRSIRFATYTLKYNRMNWVTVDGLREHWERANVVATLRGDEGITVSTSNVSALTLSFEPGEWAYSIHEPVTVSLDGELLKGPRPRSDRSWSASFVRGPGGTWGDAPEKSAGLRKKHDLQGPIDDAFMDSFVFVRPTGKSKHAKVQAWVDAELARAIEHWRRHFRGDAIVVDDVKLTDAQIASSHLVLWGDTSSNAVLRKVADKLPIRWDETSLKVGERDYDSAGHVLAMVYPNPLNPDRYVVLNSGFTFRDYDYLNNARQTPKLPDWAVIDLSTPPNSRWAGKIADANFFDEHWALKAKSTTSAARP